MPQNRTKTKIGPKWIKHRWKIDPKATKKQRKSRVGGLGPPLGGVLGPSWPLGSAKSRKSKLFPPHPPPVFDRQKLPERSFLLFFRVSAFSCFLVFFDSILIGFWTPSSLRYAAPAMLFSCFSCFEKVSILDDFCPPKMSPTPQKIEVFDLLERWYFLVFRYMHLSKTLNFLKENTCFWGFSCSLCFLENLDFSRFLSIAFWEGPDLTFWGFGRFLGPPKSTPAFKSEALVEAKNHVFS